MVGSLTKVFACPGLRAGYVIAPDPALAGRLRDRQPEWSVNGLVCSVLPELLATRDLPGWAAAIAELRGRLGALLRAYGLVPEPSDANFVFVRRAPGVRDELAARHSCPRHRFFRRSGRCAHRRARRGRSGSSRSRPRSGVPMSSPFAVAAGRVVPLDEVARRVALARQDQLTKPAGSLGALEDVGAQLAAIAGTCPPPVPRSPAVAVFAADHGVVDAGVTMWPQAVTAQMVANFAGGGAAINAIARQVGATVHVVDVGVATDVSASSPVVRGRKSEPAPTTWPRVRR